MKIHFDNDNTTINFTFDDEAEKEWANKNPDAFIKTISDIKEMHVSNNALAIAKSNNEKEYYSAYFAPIEDKKLIEPLKYNINTSFLEWHREYIFKR